MKLKDYAAEIARLAKKNPDLEVAYASDEEGNRYDYVRYNPDITEVEIDGENVKVMLVN